MKQIWPRCLSGSALLVLLALTPPLAAQPTAKTDLPTARPEDVGMSSVRLQRINTALQRYIDNHQLAGAVTLVARRGKVVHFEALGLADIDSKKPMTTDTIFRMASSTKPVTAVAVLMLMEEGKLRLNDPVSKFIPEFKDLKVTVAKSASDKDGAELVPAERPITIKDLLTHTSGLLSGGGGPPQEALRKLREMRKPTDTLADAVPRFASVPLDFQPGSKWAYSGMGGFDTLARIVEVASGETFDQFLAQRVFEPLGMKDTFFNVPESRQSRQATQYRRGPKGLEKTSFPASLMGGKYYSGAGGLSSTAEDYARFAQMLVNGGQLNGQRLLGPRTVELMGTNQVGHLFGGQLGRPKEGLGFGFGVEVVTDAVKAGWRRSNGSYGWDGAFGTIFEVDPKERMISVLMIQTYDQNIYRDFENAVRQAIID